MQYGEGQQRMRCQNMIDPKMFYENRFWNRRTDGIVINKNHRTTRMLGTCYGQQHVLSLSSQKHTQVRKAHCSWQELLLHAERCMRHEDVVKKILLAGLNCT